MNSWERPLQYLASVGMLCVYAYFLMLELSPTSYEGADLAFFMMMIFATAALLLVGDLSTLAGMVEESETKTTEVSGPVERVNREYATTDMGELEYEAKLEEALKQEREDE